MTRGEALKDFFRKTILPVASAALLYCIFRSACVKNGELDYLWLWILCGLPFGIWRLRLWIIPGGGSLGGGIALFLLNFVFAGLIGGCVLVWRLLVAAWYIPVTAYRLLTADRYSFRAMEMWKTAALPMENAFTARWKSRCLSHSPQTPFPTAPPGLAVCPQSHSAYDCCCRKNRIP